jgi:CPA2 family monovalent cation:H+ antiporter-2
MAAPHSLELYREALVFLGTAGVVIPLMARWRVSPVLGFLVAGLALGPNGLGRLAEAAPWTGLVAITSQSSIDLLGELGVVVLLFTIGLELSFARLMALRRLVFGFGLAQVALTALAVAGVALAAGLDGRAALVVGACLAFSSTAIVMQLLAEQGRLAAPAGRAAFSVLLAQDLAVVPILAVLIVVTGAPSAAGGSGVLAGLGLALLQAGATVALIVWGGRLLLRPLFRLVARARNRELFVAAALFVLVGTSVLTAAAGLSMALGAFLAGLLLSDTEFRREVEVEIDAVKGMLLGLFFISVGMRIDLAVLWRDPAVIAAAIFAMVLLKAAIVAGLARLFGQPWPVALEAGLLLGGAGEFAFVVLGLARGGGLVDSPVDQALLLVASGSMLLTPLLARLAREAGAAARRAAATADGHDAPVEAGPHAILVGYGRVGRMVGELLAEAGRPFLAVDRDADLVGAERAAGRNVAFGDASRREFLDRCGIADAPAVIVTTDNPEAAERVVRAVRAARADVPVLARARDAAHAASLFRLGATDVVSETLEASLELGESALAACGLAAAQAGDAVRARRAAEKARLSLGETG